MPDKPNPPEPAQPEGPAGQLLIYRDGATRLQVRLEGRTVWLSQRLIAELFQVSVPTVSEHLSNIYADRELDPEATLRSFRIVQTEGTRQVSRAIDHYNLDAILAVGYRVRSARGTAFRQWATARLSELLVSGVLRTLRLPIGSPEDSWLCLHLLAGAPGVVARHMMRAGMTSHRRVQPRRRVDHDSGPGAAPPGTRPPAAPPQPLVVERRSERKVRWRWTSS